MASLEVRELTRRYSDTVTVGPVSFVARERVVLTITPEDVRILAVPEGTATS